MNKLVYAGNGPWAVLVCEVVQMWLRSYLDFSLYDLGLLESY